MFTTPAGTSEVSMTCNRSSAGSGMRPDGMITQRLPIAITGASSEMNPRSGASSGQTTPITPIGSGTARDMLRTGGV